MPLSGVGVCVRSHARTDISDFEIVLIGADSLDTIRQTHGHYFADPDGEPFVLGKSRIGLARLS